MDPANGAVAAFAVELRNLRREAGAPAYRVMAGRVHFSTATLAQAAAGERLPTLPSALAYVEACGGDANEWRARWEEAYAAVREEAAARVDATRAPYRGLARFETADHASFFGRAALVERLTTLVQAHRFVLLAGPSGCGKSSLLRAGLIPALSQRPVQVLTPGPHPELNPAEGAVVVIDQFEEIFTLCQDPVERQAFIDALLATARDGCGRVVLAVRADFFGHCAHHPDLIEAVRDSTVPVGPLSPAELREAIVKPATTAGLIVQRELTARIIEEVTGQPGGLPLMSHALLETWRHRHGKALTEQAYEAAGGVHGAVANTSEALYEELTPAQRERLRHLLLRLITPGEADAHDTRRPARRAELLTGQPDDPGPMLLERLAAARLITLDDDTVDLAHEALLTAWPRLRTWVEQDREQLRVHRRLTEAADAWQEHDRDPGTLYRGLRLATAHEQLTEHAEMLTLIERDFLHASSSASQRSRRRSRRRTALVSVLVMLALIAVTLAAQQRMTNSRQEREAQARRFIGVAESLRRSDPPQSMRLSLAAWRLADLPETRANLHTASLQPQQGTFTDPDTGSGTMRWLSTDGHSLVSVGAAGVTRWDPSTGQRQSVAPGLGVRLSDAGPAEGDARWLPIQYGAVDAVTLVDLTTGTHESKPLDTANQGTELALSGRRLITYHAAGSRYRVRVWNPAARQLIAEMTTHRKKTPAPRSQEWADAWTMAREEHQGRTEAEEGVPDATLSADDSTMVLCVPGQALQLWDLTTGRRVNTPWAPTLTARQCRDELLHLTPDGRQLLMITDMRIRQWDLPSGKEVQSLDEPSVKEMGFSPDGTYLVTATATELLVWRMRERYSPLFRYPLGETAVDLRIDPATDQVRYLAGSTTGSTWPTTVRTLRLDGIVNPDWRDENATSAIFSPDGQRLATSYQNRVEVRDGRNGQRLSGPPPLPCTVTVAVLPRCLMIAAFRPDGRALAYGDAFSEPFRADVWDLAGQRVIAQSPPIRYGAGLAYTPGGDDTLLVSGRPAKGNDTYPIDALSVWPTGATTVAAPTPGISGDMAAVDPAGRVLVTSEGDIADLTTGLPIRRWIGIGPSSAMAFSPDDRLFATGDKMGQTILWDADVRHNLGTLALPSASGPITALAFSSDTHILAVASARGGIQLWDSTARQPIGAPIATPGGQIQALQLNDDTLYVATEHIPHLRYDLTPTAAAATICRRVGHDLTPDDWITHLPGYAY